MAGSMWVLVVLGVFALIVIVLGVLLIVGRLRGRGAQPLEAPPEYVPQIGAQPIPPTGSR